FFSLPLGGVASIGPLMAPAALTIPDPVLQSKYEQYQANYKFQAQQNWYSTPFGGQPQPLETSTNRPAHVASMTALFPGALATGGRAIAPPVAFAFEAQGADRRARLDTIPPSLIVPAMPGLGIPAALIPTMVVQAKATEPLPLAQVRDRLAAQTK